MRVKWLLLATFLTIGLPYAAYPYVTLYRIGNAIRSGDPVTLQSLVDWDSVREGIKEDICDLVVDDPQSKPSGGGLPPFGAGFMRGIAGNAIDQAITPQALLAATAPPSAQPTSQSGADVHINWAFFDGPTTFMVSLQAQGKPEPIKVQMALQDGSWRIDRVWLPPELLAASNSKT